MAHTQTVHTANATHSSSPAEPAVSSLAFQVPLQDGAVVVRTGGELPDSFRRLLQANGARAWAFVSAGNPHSIALSPEANRERHATLCLILEDEGYLFVSGGAAFEEAATGALIFNITPARAGQLARAFAQGAYAAGDDQRCEALVCEALDFVI